MGAYSERKGDALTEVTKPYRLVLHHPDARDAVVLDGYAVLAMVEIEPRAWTLSFRGADGEALAMMVATLLAKVEELDGRIIERAMQHLEAERIPDTAYVRNYRSDDAH
jgi:hypothetical protein